MTGADGQIAFDARDAFATPLRGWGRYARDLLGALPVHRMHLYQHGGAGPEVVFEQFRFARQARQDGASLIHAPNCFLPLRRSLPGVVTIHDLAFEVYPEDFEAKTRAKYRFCTPRAARSAQRVICVSQFTADDVAARYGVDPAKLRVVANAPSLPIGPGPALGGEPYVLAVGDLRPKKNLGRLVAGWTAAGRPCRLVLAGHGEATGLPAGVEVTGYLDDTELDALLRGAQALVHPSLYEGFGLVVAEAMARGVPVACSATTALPETAGGAAVLFDPLDPAAIWAGVEEAIGRRDELAAAGRTRAAGWSWERAAAETMAVYEELL